MKRLLAILLICSLVLAGCTQNKTEINETIVQPSVIEEAEEITARNHEESSIKIEGIKDDEEEIANIAIVPEFNTLNDPALLQYVEDTVYAGLVDEFQSEDYIIENINAIFISKEYLDEVAYNSKANIWFGYTLEELDEQFQGTPYVFTLGDSGETIAVPFEDYDDTYDQIIRNVTIGTGIILVCVTVSVVTGGAGAVPVSMIFAASAKTGTIMALSSGAFSGIVSGVITGVQTQDFNQAVKTGTLAASDGFKWGAISGVLIGGFSEANTLWNAVSTTDAIEDATVVVENMENLSQWRQAELRALSEYGGREQVTYLAGEEVSSSTAGATRPDIVRMVGDHIEAIEVKYYDLGNKANVNALYSELEREVSSRVINLPPGSTQRVVLDVTERGFSQEVIAEVTNTIQMRLMDIYPNIPIDIVGL